MKKVILILIGLVISSLAFSQSEGYLPKFISTSPIQANGFVLPDSTEYVLDYDYRSFNPKGEYIIGLEIKMYIKKLYLYRKDINGLKKASGEIRTDYFIGHYKETWFPDSLRAVNSYKCDIDSTGVVNVILDSFIWKSGQPEIKHKSDVLKLIPTSNGIYKPVLK